MKKFALVSPYFYRIGNLFDAPCNENDHVLP
jgi:hypothetical protein